MRFNFRCSVVIVLYVRYMLWDVYYEFGFVTIRYVTVRSHFVFKKKKKEKKNVVKANGIKAVSFRVIRKSGV